MKKRVLSLALALSLCLGLTAPAFAAEPPKEYTLTIEDITDEQLAKDAIRIQYYLEADKYRVCLNYRVGQNQAEARISSPAELIEPRNINDPSLGKPFQAPITVLDGNGKPTGETMNITYVPLRLLAESMADLGYKVEWVNGVPGQTVGHAELTVPNKGTYHFYNGNKFVTDPITLEKLYETAYTLPDGSPCPVALVRQGRFYLPLRFVSEIMFSTVEIDPYKKPGWVYVTALTSQDAIAQTYGVNSNIVSSVDPDYSLCSNFMSALKKVEEERGWTWDAEMSQLHVSEGNEYLTFSAVNNPNGDGYAIYIGGMDWAERCPTVINGVITTRESDFTGEIEVIEALLKDTVCDADREAIINTIKTAHKELNNSTRSFDVEKDAKYTFSETTMQYYGGTWVCYGIVIATKPQ